MTTKLNTLLGILGTGASLSLADWHQIAAVSAGFATAAYMLTSIFVKLRKPKSDD